jgi:hypothetical protein
LFISYKEIAPTGHKMCPHSSPLGENYKGFKPIGYCVFSLWSVLSPHQPCKSGAVITPTTS